MKKAIVISLVVLLLNSASAFVFAQTLPPATEKAFTAAYDAARRQRRGDRVHNGYRGKGWLVELLGGHIHQSCEVV